MASSTMTAFRDMIRRNWPDLKLTADAPMASFTSLRLGGPADLLAEPNNEETLRALLDAARASDVPVTVIGRGTNLLVRDGGIRGLVIRIGPEMNAITLRDGTNLTAAAGASLTAVSAYAAEHSLSGLVFACGIPGSCGGAVYMNAGAYGGEMKDVVASVSGFDMTGRPFWYTGNDMGFGYRTSRLQIEEKVVTAVTFALIPGSREDLESRMAANNARRREKQPLDVPSAGSTFRRPKEGFAAELIERCGLKGLSIGGAQVSEKHAGFLINRGTSAADFIALMERVQRTVLEQTGISLEPEVVMLGEDSAE